MGWVVLVMGCGSLVQTEANSVTAARHLEQDLFEGSRGLGDLDDPDLMIEGELGHRRGGRAVNGQAVVGDVGLDVPAMQEAGELGRLAACGRPRSNAHGRASWTTDSAASKLPPPTTIEVVREHLEFRDQVARHEDRAAAAGEGTQ